MAPRSKREEILAVAGDLFVRHGFEKISMDQIAEAVPVSKPTLYSNFDDKKALFSAVIGTRCEKLLAHIRGSIVEGQSVEQILENVGVQFLTMVTSKDSLRMHRTLAYECEAFPDITRQFYESGPSQMHRMLKEFLAGQKKLKVKDPGMSAEMFLSMLKGFPHMLALFNIAGPPTPKEIEARVKYAVDLFVKAHSA
jgi:TetR/AcrR family transcriptional repressor of mexJK operon